VVFDDAGGRYWQGSGSLVTRRSLEESAVKEDQVISGLSGRDR
jgi:hypothetical protein